MRLLAKLVFCAATPVMVIAGVNTIFLRDGRTISGRFLDGNAGTVGFEDDNGRQYRFRTADVQSISFANPRFDRGNDVQSPVAILPAGTELSVRTTSTINSREADDNQIFPAFVDRDVRDSSGNVVIPRGSAAELVIRSMNGGRLRESSSLVLDVQAVTVNGTRFRIDTEDLTRTGGGRDGIGANRRTGEFVGGGTALGTLLGAVAGGGKGALIGALAGAVAGAGTEVLTKGGEVRVPSETVLTFRLDQQITMNPRY